MKVSENNNMIAEKAKAMGGGKRKTPEKGINSENPATNTRLGSRISKEKEKNEYAIEPDKFKLKRTQNFLKRLVGQSAKNIIAKKAKIEESLQEILDENPSVDQLKTSKLGQDLQVFANSCGKIPSLAQIQKSVQSVLDKLKRKVILALFGKEEFLNPGSDSIKDSESHRSNPIKEKGQSAHSKELEEHIIKEAESEVQPENTSPKEVYLKIKEPAVMLVVCKEIADLLKKVMEW
eukprot:TRINITY_DN14145_c0_g1_i5.p1 TRINITY_DN14145_c0_g1~~TRINITY_DN14145_c0_g1_i5.p1  ORF type:complete len:235 (-),score=61.14 TRINITY_DN14145_c0_g1_i5:313-1017(-)